MNGVRLVQAGGGATALRAVAQSAVIGQSLFSNLEIETYPSATSAARVSAVVLSAARGTEPYNDSPNRAVVFRDSVVRVNSTLAGTQDVAGIERPNDPGALGGGSVFIHGVSAFVNAIHPGRAIGFWGGGAVIPGKAGPSATAARLP